MIDVPSYTAIFIGGGKWVMPGPFQALPVLGTDVTSQSRYASKMGRDVLADTCRPSRSPGHRPGLVPLARALTMARALTKACWHIFFILLKKVLS